MDYSWRVTRLKKLNTEFATDVVVQTYWICVGTDEEGRAGQFNGATPFSSDVGSEDFIPFESLTEEIVLGWIQSSVNLTHIYSIIDEQIDNIKKQELTVSENELPWVVNTNGETSV